MHWRFSFLLPWWWCLPDVNLGLLYFFVIILLGLSCKVVQPCEVEIESFAEAELIWMVRHSLWVMPPTSVLGSLVRIVSTSIGWSIVICTSVDRVRFIFFELNQLYVIPMPTKPQSLAVWICGFVAFPILAIGVGTATRPSVGCLMWGSIEVLLVVLHKLELVSVAVLRGWHRYLIFIFLIQVKSLSPIN